MESASPPRCRNLRPLSLDRYDAEDLGPAGGAFRPECIASVRKCAELSGSRARDGFRRGPRRRLRRARRAHRDDLRALPRRHQPQRGRVRVEGAMRQGRAGACCRRCWTTTASSRSAAGAGADGSFLMDLFVFAAVLFAAACHAGWNASIKRTLDPLATTVLIALGAGLARCRDPWSGLPTPAAWPWLIASTLIHIFYFAGLIESYRAGDLGQVYPIARGAAPLMTAIIAALLFVGERARDLRLGRHRAAGGGRAACCRCAAGAILRRSTAAPSALRCSPRFRSAPTRSSTASACAPRARARPRPIRSCCSWRLRRWWCLCAGRRGVAVLPAMVPYWKIGLGGGALAVISYTIALWAMTVAPIAIVAALRETSVLFGADRSPWSSGSRCAPPGSLRR
jgi:hypothetical protein